MKIEHYGHNRIVTYLDGVELVYQSGRITTWYIQKGNRYYCEEESTNVRNMGNALRRISRSKFEEIRKLIIESA